MRVSGKVATMSNALAAGATALEIIQVLETVAPEVAAAVKAWCNADGDEAKKVAAERAAMMSGVDAYQKWVDAQRSAKP
jgi:hypothetical protein